MYVAMTLGMEVANVEQLIPYLAVTAYEGDPNATPPGVAKLSGFLVRDILEGRAGWSLDEIEEFKQWIANSESARSWLEQTFEKVSAELRIAQNKLEADVFAPVFGLVQIYLFKRAGHRKILASHP